MGKKDAFIFVAGIAAETAGVGVGMIPNIHPFFPVFFIALGVSVLVYSIFKIWRYNPEQPTWMELKARGEAKRWYLEPLLETLQQVIDFYKSLSQQAINFPLAKYNEKYFRVDTTNIKDIKAKLVVNRYWLNNLYYKELKDAHGTDSLIRDYEKWYSEVTDKRLRFELGKLWRREHQATSNEIFFEIDKVNFPETVNKRRLQEWNKGNTKDEFNAQLNIVKERIQQLLGGIPDER